jgi:hypothetical protein
MHRSREEVDLRCRSIINRPDIVSIVDRSSSPTSAYDMVMTAVGDEEVAKAGRWLGVLRRDYPDAYAALTKNVLHHATAGTVKEGTDETTIRSGPVVPAQ